MNKDRANQIISLYDEFSLLNRYKNIPLEDLNDFVGEDLICMKEFHANSTGIDHAKASTFVDFLKEFKFYVQGGGTTFPANFKDINYRQTYGERKLLSEEMIRIYGEIVEKSNGKTSATTNQH